MFNCWEVRGPALVLFLFYVTLSRMLLWSHLSSRPLTIPAPWVLLRIGWSILLVPPWVTAFRFFAGNREAELKPTTFSSLLLFHIFLSLLFSWPPSNILSLSISYWGYFLIIIIIIFVYGCVCAHLCICVRKGF